MPSDVRTACPDRERLVAFWLGQLTCTDLEEVATHLSGCSACEAQLRDLRPVPDTFLGNLQEVRQGGPRLEAECLRLEQLAQAMRVDLEVTRHQGPQRAEPDMPLPQRLGHYRLLARLGKGGMGAVYRAEHVNLRRPVALKLLPDEYLHHPQAVARFYREMQAVGRLDHPHVIRATDAGEADGRHFLVMEYVDGLDLGRLVRRHGPLPIADACELVRQAALGLQYVHEQGLVHRDIKPSNLFLTIDGQVKVLDLGLARLWDDRPAEGDLTSTGQAMGTADYMAPEQGIDARHVDIRADIYSLGCTLFRLLTGDVPYGEPKYRSTVEKFRAHALAPVPSVRERRPEVPAELDAVVRRMLAKTAEERYATPGEVTRELQRFAMKANLANLVDRVRTHEPLDCPAINDSAETHVREPITAKSHRLPRPLRIGGMATALLVLVGLVVVAGLPRHSLNEESPPPTGPQRPGHVAAVGDAPGAMQFMPEIEQMPPEALPPPPEKPTVGTWYNALAVEPRELVWPPGRSVRPYNAQRREVFVNCEKLGLLSLGRISSPSFLLSLDVTQERWTGGIGLFFGYHEAKEGNVSVRRYQRIELRPTELNKPSSTFQLLRVRSIIRPGAGGQPLMSNDTVVGAQVPAPSPRTSQTLAIAIQNSQLAQVQWAGTSMTDLCQPAANAWFTPAYYEGEFGIYTLMSGGTFANARYILLDEGRNP